MNVHTLKEKIFSIEGLCNEEELLGCSEEELREIEERLGCKLPMTYKAIMKLLGKGAGNFLDDMQLFYPDVIGLTEKSRSLIFEFDGEELPEDSYVFAAYWGDYVYYFNTNEGDDPVVYQWWIERRGFHQCAKSLFDFFESNLKGG